MWQKLAENAKIEKFKCDILIDLNAINQYGITAFYIYACINGHTDDVDFSLVLFINIKLSIL